MLEKCPYGRGVPIEGFTIHIHVHTLTHIPYRAVQAWLMTSRQTVPEL